MKRISTALTLGLFVALTACSNTEKKEGETPNTAKLNEILDSSHRSEDNKARDQFRNPEQTLSFFEVEPDMKVLEISPGSGWYTEILAPYLREEGQLVLAIFDDASSVDYRKRLNTNLKEKLSAAPETYGSPEFVTFDVPEKMGPLGEKNSYDRVLTFRNLHNWMKSGKLEAAFEAFHDSLKPGGMLGVVEHRSKLEADQDPNGSSGYVQEDYVIKMAEKAGFTFVGKSEVNANAKDTTDHPKGVWTLPPSLRLGDKDKEKYTAIGESDRMTLKFKK